MKDTIKLTKSQQKVLDILVDASNKDKDIKIFLSHFATGKTFFFNYVEKYFKNA